MRIAFIVTEFPSMSQTFVLNQITGLIDLGQEVDIFALKAGDEDKIPDDVLSYRLLENTYYLKNQPTNKLFRIIKAFIFVSIYIFKNPLLILRSLNFFKYGKLSLSFGLLYYIIPFLKKKPYDIVHCHFGPSGLVGVLLKSVGVIKGKLITSFHAYDLTSYLYLKGVNTYKKLFEIGDLFQPVSDYWKKKLIDLGCNESKINVHRMGIDVSKFSFSTTRFKKLSKIRVLSVNRLVEKKGIEYAIKAFAKVIEKYPDTEYSIVGDGPLKDKLFSLINELDVKGKICILGWRQQSEIQALMDKSNIFLAPSVTDKNGEKEGIPVVLMEAMAKGLAVISTYHSGIPELIVDYKTGLLVQEKDVEGLAKKIEYIILKPDKIKIIAIEARKVIEKHYNIEKLNKILLNTYQKMVYS